jgi:hypothetical protein
MKTHWDAVYASKTPTVLSWYQPSPGPSIAMIRAANLTPGAAVADVGAGASSLVDWLVGEGYRVTALDVSENALSVARRRLADRGDQVDWTVSDVRRWRPPPGAYDLWHDRAVFHFLLTEAGREAYKSALRRGLRKGGDAIFGTFSPTGPERCSGLPVRRYSAAGLSAELGSEFELASSAEERHATPSGAHQDFTWCLFRRVAD